MSTIVLLSCNSATNRSDVPVGRSVATSVLDIPLPVSAHNIYYLDFAGGLQDLERYIRFDVDPSEITAAVDALITENNAMHGRSLPYPVTSLTTTDLPIPRPEFLPLPWWTPGSATTGYYRGHIDAYALRILVDEGNSRIYIYQND